MINIVECREWYKDFVTNSTLFYRILFTYFSFIMNSSSCSVRKGREQWSSKRIFLFFTRRCAPNACAYPLRSRNNSIRQTQLSCSIL